MMEHEESPMQSTSSQTYRHFLCKSPWKGNPVIDQLSLDANRCIGGRVGTCLLIDTSIFPQKGRLSVGCSRQSSRRPGKLINCQIGLFAVLGWKQYLTPIDCRLYLPKAWVDNKECCQRAGIPDEFMEYQHKRNLAVQLVMAARLRGAQFSWIGCTVTCGDNLLLLRSLENMAEIFIAAVHKGQHIYLDDPSPFVPVPKSGKGRPPTKLRTERPSIRLDMWVDRQPESAWKKVVINGKIQAAVLHRRIWLWDGKNAAANYWRLIVRKSTGGEIKYSLSNAPPEISLERLIDMQYRHLGLECAFQNAKSQCGMGQYEAGSWHSWHHYMAITMLAMLFMLQQQLEESLDDASFDDNKIGARLNNHNPTVWQTSEEDSYHHFKTRHENHFRAMQSVYCRQLIKNRFDAGPL